LKEGRVFGLFYTFLIIVGSLLIGAVLGNRLRRLRDRKKRQGQ